MTIPTIIFLPLVLWPICWMVVQVVRSDNANDQGRRERLLDYLSQPTWSIEPIDEEES